MRPCGQASRGPSPSHPHPACLGLSVPALSSQLCFQEACSFYKMFSKNQFCVLMSTSWEFLFLNLFTLVLIRMAPFLCLGVCAVPGSQHTPWWGPRWVCSDRVPHTEPMRRSATAAPHTCLPDPHSTWLIPCEFRPPHPLTSLLLPK